MAEWSFKEGYTWSAPWEYWERSHGIGNTLGKLGPSCFNTRLLVHFILQTAMYARLSTSERFEVRKFLDLSSLFQSWSFLAKHQGSNLITQLSPIYQQSLHAGFMFVQTQRVSCCLPQSISISPTRGRWTQLQACIKNWLTTMKLKVQTA